MSLGGRRSRSPCGWPDRGAQPSGGSCWRIRLMAWRTARVTLTRARSDAEPARRCTPAEADSAGQLADEEVTFRLGLDDTSDVAEQSRFLDVLVDLGKPPAVGILGLGVEKDTRIPPSGRVQLRIRRAGRASRPESPHALRGRGRGTPDRDARGAAPGSAGPSDHAGQRCGPRTTGTSSRLPGEGRWGSAGHRPSV